MPKTILYLAWAPFFSGAERALLLLVRGLDKNRYKPFVIVGTNGVLRDELERSGVSTAHVELRQTDWRHAARWLTSTMRVAAIARSQRAALIHSNEAPSFHPAGYAAKVLRIPAVAHVRFPDGDFSWLLKPGFSRAVFISNHMYAEAASRHPGLFDGRAEVIHDAAVITPPSSVTERSSAKEALGVPPTATTILLAGQIAEFKGVWDYIEAARIIVGSGRPAMFVVLGDDLQGHGKLRRQAEEQVRALGLTDRFRFLGFRPNASELIPVFDIVAVPSHVEPLGLAALEAMAAGRPVVGSRVGGIPEMVIEEETGFLVPPRDPEALATALLRLIDDPALRDRLGAAGRRRASSAFSVPLCAERVQALYDRLLLGSEARARGLR